MLNLTEIKELTPPEIDEQVKKSQVELVNLRMKFAARQLEDTSLIKKKRKEIAKMLTVKSLKLKENPNAAKSTVKVKKERKKKTEPKAVKKKEGK
ncbi:MAG: 50S ribosomal protein L29 [Candidatus Melainabacteria bacterium RIFCSPHIGHO2_02_FULL_34_12]|nr:MAG: 50S ribosomal protein L29 [Candidatus Melainabacteria bacterium RIFCSPHIGHO2_02_FULL_34_12]